MRFHSPITRRVQGIVRAETSAELLTRRQLLLQWSKSMPSPKSGVGICGGSTAAEVCGGTTAGCAAVWCCCPCGIVNLLVLAIYKVPARLCRKVLRHRRLRRLIKGGSLPVNGNECRCRERSEQDWLELKMLHKEEKEETAEVAAAAAQLEKEMWNRFYGTGFWRSPSQTETASYRVETGLDREKKRKPQGATVEN